VAQVPPDGHHGWLRRVADIGKPLVLGLAVFAVVGGLCTWALVHVLWTLAVCLKRRRRLRGPPLAS